MYSFFTLTLHSIKIEMKRLQLKGKSPVSENWLGVARRGFILKDTCKQVLTYLLSTSPVQAAVGAPDKGPSALLNSRKGKRSAQQTPTWDSTLQRCKQCAQGDLLCTDRWRRKEVGVFWTKMVHHRKLPHHNIKWNTISTSPVSQNIYVHIHVEINCWALKILSLKICLLNWPSIVKNLWE